jgi:hypothetical protein
MSNAVLLNKAKLAARITTSAFDDQISDLLEAAVLDLGVAGVEVPEQYGPLVNQAAITYFLMHFGQPDEYDRLKASYDEQKAQLSTCTGYTDWGDIDGSV